jgi:hypothetical protein
MTESTDILLPDPKLYNVLLALLAGVLLGVTTMAGSCPGATLAVARPGEWARSPSAGLLFLSPSPSYWPRP